MTHEQRNRIKELRPLVESGDEVALKEYMSLTKRKRKRHSNCQICGTIIGIAQNGPGTRCQMHCRNRHSAIYFRLRIAAGALLMVVLCYFIQFSVCAAPWANRFGGIYSDNGSALSLYNQTNLIMAGYFKGEIVIGTSNFPSAGTNNNFLLSQWGTDGAFKWAKRWFGTSDEVPNAIATDSSGNIFACGMFYGAANFGGTNMVNTAAYHDAWIAKYDSGGNHLWSRGVGNNVENTFDSIAVDSSGNVIVIGTFNGTINCGGTNLVAPVSGSVQTTVMAKYASDGTHLWSKAFPSSSPGLGNGPNYCYGVSVDRSDNIYIAGRFFNWIDFGGGVVSATASRGNIYIAKFLSDSSYVWGRKWGYYGDIGLARGDQANCITIDASTNVIIGGIFYKQTDLGGGMITGPANENDGYIAKYSGVDGSYIWANPFLAANACNVRSLACDSNKNVFVVGNFYQSCNFGLGTITSLSLSLDSFLVKCSSTGTILSATNYGGTRTDNGASVVADNNGVPYVCGQYQANQYDIGFPSFVGISVTNAGLYDGILFSEGPPVAPSPPVITVQPQDQSIPYRPSTPGPFTVTATGTAPLSYQWMTFSFVDAPLGLTVVTNATNSSYTPPCGGNNPPCSINRIYSVVITNLYGGVTSSIAQIYTGSGYGVPLPTNLRLILAQ